MNKGGDGVMDLSLEEYITKNNIKRGKKRADSGDVAMGPDCYNNVKNSKDSNEPVFWKGPSVETNYLEIELDMKNDFENMFNDPDLKVDESPEGLAVRPCSDQPQIVPNGDLRVKLSANAEQRPSIRSKTWRMMTPNLNAKRPGGMPPLVPSDLVPPTWPFITNSKKNCVQNNYTNKNNNHNNSFKKNFRKRNGWYNHGNQNPNQNYNNRNQINRNYNNQNHNNQNHNSQNHNNQNHNNQNQNNLNKNNKYNLGVSHINTNGGRPIHNHIENNMLNHGLMNVLTRAKCNNSTPRDITIQVDNFASNSRHNPPQPQRNNFTSAAKSILHNQNADPDLNGPCDISHASIMDVLGIPEKFTTPMKFASKMLSFFDICSKSEAVDVHRPIYDLNVQKEIHDVQCKQLVYKSPGGDVISADGNGIQNFNIMPSTTGITLNHRFS